MTTKKLVDIAEWQQTVQEVLKLAKREGASSADVNASFADGFTVNVRLGEIDTIEYHRDKGIDITVYMGQQQGSSSTNDLSQAALENAVKAACAIAKATGADACNGLPDTEELAYQYPDLNLHYPWNIDVNQGIEIAKQCEEYGRAFDPRIANSDGASLTTYQSFFIQANSDNFMGHYQSSRHSFNCVLLAESGKDKQRDYEFTVARDPKDLLSVKYIGEEAAKKALARLNAQKLSTRQTPVVFVPQVACGVISHFATAIRGTSLYRQASFLLDKLNKPVFPELIKIIEQPHLLKALGSVPFDCEGVKTRARTIVDAGILQSYILSTYSARKLGLKTTGNSGGVHNLCIEPTTGDLNEILKQMDTGLLVTEVMGQGVNILTGDYSRGATGFWVEQGKIQYPVHEITIAGNLREMFLQLQAVGNDIDKRGSIWSGSLLIEKMTVAGE